MWSNRRISPDLYAVETLPPDHTSTFFLFPQIILGKAPQTKYAYIDPREDHHSPAQPHNTVQYSSPHSYYSTERQSPVDNMPTSVRMFTQTSYHGYRAVANRS